MDLFGITGVLNSFGFARNILVGGEGKGKAGAGARCGSHPRKAYARRDSCKKKIRNCSRGQQEKHLMSKLEKIVRKKF